jgi:hypothetical protein
MARTRTLEEVLRIITPIINDWEIFYVAVEELAKKAYGFPREFDEIELLVNLTDEETNRVGRYLESELLERIGEAGPCTFHKDKKGNTTIKLTRSQDQLDMMTIGRRVIQDYSFSSVFVASIEDLVIRELRGGGRKRMAEALELYSYWKNHLDISYMVSSTRQLGLYDRFIKIKKKGDRKR